MMQERKKTIDVEARVREYYAHLDRLAARIPDEWVEESRERLVNAILADLARESWPERARRWITELLTERPLALTGLVTATLAVIVCAVLLHDPASPRPEAPDAVAQADAALPAAAPSVATPSAPAPTSPAVAATPTPIAPAAPPPIIAEHPTTEQKPAPANLATLRAEFERLKASDTGVGRAYLVRLVDHIVAQEDRETAEFAALCLLLVETYEQMGERDRALAAYGRYLDIVEAREGPSSTIARQVLSKAEDLFGLADYHGAIGYCDLILTRYPESREAAEADYMIGQYFERIDRLDLAGDHYREVAERRPGTRVARRATERLPEVLFNQGRADDAYTAARDHAEAFRDVEIEQVHLYLRLGMMKAARGDYAGALQAFQTLLRDHPQSPYTPAAEQMIARIHRQVIGTDFLN